MAFTEWPDLAATTPPSPLGEARAEEAWSNIDKGTTDKRVQSPKQGKKEWVFAFCRVDLYVLITIA
jgi:hypothetical protein